jgi:hypothetical protein
MMMMTMVFAGYEMWRDSYEEKKTKLLRADMEKRAAARRAEVAAERRASEQKPGGDGDKGNDR